MPNAEIEIPESLGVAGRALVTDLLGLFDFRDEPHQVARVIHRGICEDEIHANLRILQAEGRYSKTTLGKTAEHPAGAAIRSWVNTARLLDRELALVADHDENSRLPRLAKGA